MSGSTGGVRSPLFIITLFVVIKLLVHLFTNTNYGFHRDELLYLAVSERLSVFRNEFPPLIAILGYFKLLISSESLFVVRLLPALAGGAIVLISGLMVREIGGGRFAQLLTGITILFAPLYLRSSTLFQPVIFEQLLWTISCYLVILINNRNNSHLWYVLGVILGFGLLTKFTILIFGFALFIGLLLTSQRHWLYRKEPWLAGLIALIIGVPGITGQIVNDFPLFTHIEHISETQFAQVGVLDFLVGQIMMLNPLSFPVWIGGLYYFLIHKKGTRYRLFGVCYVAALMSFLIIGGKEYYLGPMYAVLIAGGAFFIETLLGAGKRTIIKSTVLSLLVLSGLYLLPIGIPLLSPEKLEKYIQYAGLEEATKNNRGEYERIPQDFADMFGWENQVKEVAGIYNILTEEERAKSIILAGNYGRAGAIDLFGENYGLPKAVSYVSSYHSWGPGTTSGEIAIAVGVSLSILENLYENIELKSSVSHAFAVQHEQNVPVYLCRNPKVKIRSIWEDLKRP